MADSSRTAEWHDECSSNDTVPLDLRQALHVAAIGGIQFVEALTCRFRERLTAIATGIDGFQVANQRLPVATIVGMHQECTQSGRLAVEPGNLLVLLDIRFA